MHNCNETWHILKSSYVEKMKIISFQNDRSYLLISAKITCTAFHNKKSCLNKKLNLLIYLKENNHISKCWKREMKIQPHFFLFHELS